MKWRSPTWRVIWLSAAGAGESDIFYLCRDFVSFLLLIELLQVARFEECLVKIWSGREARNAKDEEGRVETGEGEGRICVCLYLRGNFGAATIAEWREGELVEFGRLVRLHRAKHVTAGVAISISV